VNFNLFHRKKDSSILYIEALEALLLDDSDGAFEKLRELIREDTENIRAYLKLGDIFRLRSQANQAIKIHRSLTFRRHLSVAMKIDIYKSLSLDYYEVGRFDRAEDSANRILKFDRKNRWALEFLIDISEKMKRWEIATKYLKRLDKVIQRSDFRKHSYYFLMQGLERDDDGLFKEAKGFYNKAIKQDSSYANPYLHLGNLEQKSGNLESAVANWIIFAKKSTTDAGKEIYDYIEKALFELGRFGEVEDFYSSLIDKNEKNIQAIAGLVNVLAAKGDFSGAESILNDNISKEKESISLRLTKLKLELRNKKEDALCSQIDEIVLLMEGIQ
tara:strand:+ start:3759 stop:4748 length:990 start_codon:yes stop_codon:yes gene_type:complete